MERVRRQAESLGVYISVPFCRSKCTFCNFASDVYAASELPRYLGLIHAQATAARRQANGLGLVLPESMDTLYLGGGTPSLLSTEQLTTVFAALREQFTVDPDAEITLEAAPGFLAGDLPAAAAELGVTRISFGVQTFVDTEARSVGRLHTAAQAHEDIERAQSAGMAVSLDLIAGLPGQTAASWRHSLDTLIAAKPEHASVYMLEVDEDSRLGGEMLLGGARYGAGLTPSDDAVADFYVEACEALNAAGMAQYEISNFARAGHSSRHNLRYWQRRPYLGLGLDAHSMLRTPAGHAVRFGTTDDLNEYLGGERETPDGFGKVHRLSRQEELEEAWFLGLRCNAGVSLAQLSEEFGARGHAAIGPHAHPGASAIGVAGARGAPHADDPLEPFLPVLGDLVGVELLTLQGIGTDLTAALTQRGRLLSNEVFACFLGVGETEESQLSAAAAR